MATKTLSRILIFTGILALVVAGAAIFQLLRPPGNACRADLAGSNVAKVSTNLRKVSSGTATPEKGKVLYYCPMHPNYISDRPGTCPICNMDLVPMTPGETEEAKSGVEDHATITLSPERRQLIGVQVGTVEKKRVALTIRAAGRVEYNEKTLATVNLKFGGWVEELMVKSVGEPVRKGTPLFAIYSPDLLEAQRNYLLARAAAAAVGSNASADLRTLAEESAQSARERLRLWDFTEEQFQSLDAKQQPERRVTIFSKTDGIVTARNVTLGGYVEPGRNLYEIADLTTVWMTADVYEYEAPLVKVGQEAKIELTSMPGETLTGVVTYVYPYLNETTRTVRVRMEFPNRDGRLKPGMYSTVSVAVDLGEQLVVDDDAVLDTGLRQIVFVDKGEGKLEPREVMVGERTDGLATIVKGLQAGEKVVTSGNFLVDSESRLKAALKQGAAAGMSGHEGHAGMKMDESEPQSGKTGQEQKSSMPGMPGMPGM